MGNIMIIDDMSMTPPHSWIIFHSCIYIHCGEGGYIKKNIHTEHYTIARYAISYAFNAVKYLGANCTLISRLFLCLTNVINTMIHPHDPTAANTRSPNASGSDHNRYLGRLHIINIGSSAKSSKLNVLLLLNIHYYNNPGFLTLVQWIHS